MNQQQQQQQAPDVFCLLTDDLLFTIFEFIGLFEYRFVAILNQRFRKLYTEFQKQRIHPPPMESSPFHPRDFAAIHGSFGTSLTSMASVAESIDRAMVLMKDMKNGESNRFIKLSKWLGDGTPALGSFYNQGYHHEPISGDPAQIQLFLRDKVALPYGNIELLQWLRDTIDCPLDESSCELAARCSQLKVLQWLHANGCPWNELTCAYAARKGQLDMLQWARAHGCPWDAYTCLLAARNGHLEVLQWARANGCPESPRCTVAGT